MNTTQAFLRFQQVSSRTTQLLDIANLGVGKHTEMGKDILAKFSDIPTIKGRKPKNYEPQLDIKKDKEDDEQFMFEMDEITASILRKTVEFGLKESKKITFHFNAIILVYVWATFETYFSMVFKELLCKNTEMLKSSETITLKSVIENNDNLVHFLVDREIEKIGHYNVEEYIKYLSNKINYTVEKAEEKKLKELYWVRNIIAHNTGIVFDASKHKVPKEISVIDEELQINKLYITKAIKLIDGTVSKIENHIQTKFRNRA